MRRFDHEQWIQVLTHWRTPHQGRTVPRSSPRTQKRRKKNTSSPLLLSLPIYYSTLKSQAYHRFSRSHSSRSSFSLFSHLLRRHHHHFWWETQGWFHLKGLVALLQIFCSGSSDVDCSYFFTYLDFFGTYYWNVVGGDQAVRIKK